MKKIVWLICLLLFFSGLAVAQKAPQAARPGQVPPANLSWTESTQNVDSFNIYRGLTPGGENYATPLASTPGTQFAYSDTSVACWNTYYYTATAVLSGAESAPSNEVSKVIPCPSPPLLNVN